MEKINKGYSEYKVENIKVVHDIYYHEPTVINIVKEDTLAVNNVHKMKKTITGEKDMFIYTTVRGTVCYVMK